MLLNQIADLGKLNSISIVLFDLDGVFFQADSEQTDYAKIRSETRAIIKIAKKINIKLGIISSGNYEKLATLFQEEGIKDICFGYINKLDAAELLIKKYNLEYSNIAYIGNDLLDLPLLEKAGFSIAPSIARREVKRKVNYIAKNKVGKSIISEILELISDVRKK